MNGQHPTKSPLIINKTNVSTDILNTFMFHLSQQQQQPQHPHAAAQLQMQLPQMQFYPAQLAPQAPDPYAAQQQVCSSEIYLSQQEVESYIKVSMYEK